MPGLGGQVLTEPFDVFDAGRMAVVQDPTGAVFCLWEARRHHGATIINEPGSLVWNELMTGDPQKAGRFYESLVGW